MKSARTKPFRINVYDYELVRVQERIKRLSQLALSNILTSK